MLSHRIVFAPCTRLRANEAHEPTDLVTQYYAQRASDPGTLLITESACIAARAAGYHKNVPGIWSDRQLEAWKKVNWFNFEMEHQFDDRLLPSGY